MDEIDVNYPADQPPAEGRTSVPVKKEKLTKEERGALKKQKKLIKKQKELDLQKQQFRDYLDRELKYSSLTYKRAAADWEAMCAGIKLKELHDDIRELWQSVNRTLDNKNHKLELLMTEIDIAEEQYRRNFSKHSDILEYLIKLYKLFVDITKAAYQKDATDLIVEFEEDLSEKNKIHDNRKKYYENVLHATNLMTQNILDTMKNRFILDENELKDTHVAKRLYYRDSTVKKMEQLQVHMEKIVADLQGDALNSKREQLYNAYVERQEQATKECAIFNETSKHLLNAVATHQSKLSSSESNKNMEIVKLRGERSYFVEHYWQLKHNHKLRLKKHDHRLRYLASESHKAITKLKKLIKYGELVLSLSVCCGKLLTEREKVTPWPELVVDDVPEDMKKIEEAGEHLLDQMRSMQYFWTRVSQAETHVLCLKEEKKVLQQENANLCEIIKSYCEMQAYNKIICSLQISPYSTSTIPIQEASQMPQMKKL